MQQMGIVKRPRESSKASNELSGLPKHIAKVESMLLDLNFLIELTYKLIKDQQLAVSTDENVILTRSVETQEE